MFQTPKKKKGMFIFFAFLLFLTFSVCAFADDGTFSLFGRVFAFIKGIFVPRSNYFNNQISSLNELARIKFGGIAYLYLMINQFFLELKNAPIAGLAVSMPDNFYFNGYHGFSMDFFSTARPYIAFVRGLLTSGYCLFIALVSYHKLRTFFKE